VLGREVRRKRGAERSLAGRGRVRRHDQHRLEQGLEKILKGARVGGRGGEPRVVCGPKEVGIRFVPLGGLVFLLDQRAVMVVVSVPDGRLVDGGLLEGGVHPTQPS
jgi:hypothetical protein